MPTRIEEIATAHSPETLVGQIGKGAGTILLRSGLVESGYGRYSFVATDPFLTFRSYGARCELGFADRGVIQFGNPWRILDSLMARYELLDEVDLPFPLGGCFGYWGYDLKHFVEPQLQRRAVDDLELPDSCVGFYESLVVFDHHLQKTWLVSSGLMPDGSRSERRASARLEEWKRWFEATPPVPGVGDDLHRRPVPAGTQVAEPDSNLSRASFLRAVRKAKQAIRHGEIYQVNLARRLHAESPLGGWELFQRLAAVSPAPFSGYMHCGEFEVVSSSPELFLRMSGSQIVTRPIKGTRPRSPDPLEDARFTEELQTSEKELAELVMITDLLRNDIGKVCEFGSVHVPEMICLERYSQVQHLVSTIEGRLREGTTHFQALSACFPGGSITGVPKFRAMQLIEELEPVTRGPYTGCLGYLGFNRESQMNILIRSAIHRAPHTWFHAGAGIVADSDPEAEYEETLAKAGGWVDALTLPAGAPPSST